MSQAVNSQEIITATLTVFAVISTGAFCRSREFLSADSIKSMMKVLVSVLMPCFIFQNLAGKDITGAYQLPFLGICMVLLSMLVVRILSLFLAKPLGLDTNDKVKSFTYTTALQNYGFLPIPLLMMLFGKELLPLLLLHNVAIEIFVWTFGVSYLSGNIGWGIFKKVLSPPAAAAIIAVLINYFQVDVAAFPEIVTRPIDLISHAAIPTALLLIGGTVYEEVQQLSEFKSKWKSYFNISIASSIIRLGVLPAIMLSCLYSLNFSDDIKKILLLQLAMPAAMMPIVITRLYGGHTLTVIKISVITSVLSLITINFWLSFGQKILFP